MGPESGVLGKPFNPPLPNTLSEAGDWEMRGSSGRVVKRISMAARVRSYTGFMIDRLMEWIEKGDTPVYDDPYEMIDDADDYIYERLLEAPDHLTPCYGALSTRIFVEYVFNGELLDDYYIYNELADRIEVIGSIDDARWLVTCYDEMVKFKKVLKGSIKVKIRGAEDEEG